MNEDIILKTIKQAAHEKKILKILYREKKSGIIDGWRYVEPYSLSCDDGENGFFAWDINKNGIRRFSLERIVELIIIDSTYFPRYKIKI